MLDYTGVKCPVCGVPFQKDDDIVVCPECGAPYHRECYQKAGKCVFEDLHREGKEWQPPEPPKAPDVSAEIKDRECPVCGTLNGHSALFCCRCGASLLGEPKTYNNTYPGRGQAGDAPRTPPPYSPHAAPPFSWDPMGGVSPAETLDTNVTYGDASKLVRQNTSYYMPVFRYIKQTGRNKFNFSAFLFSGAWMLYRKQYKQGILVTCLMFALYAAYICSMYLVAVPAMYDLAVQAGIDPNQFLSLSNEQYFSISSLAVQQPMSYLKLILPLAFLAAILIVMIVLGVRGNKLYLKHCARTVREIKLDALSGDDPSAGMSARGGVNSMVPLCVALCYFAVRTLLLLLL